VERLGLSDPFVCYQGAQVRTPSGETWLDRGIPHDLAAEVIRLARERDLHVQVYRDDQLLVERDRPEAHQYANHAGIAITFVPDLIEAMGEVTPKLVIVAASEVLEQLLPETRARWQGRLFVTTSLPTFLEFTDVHSDKRSALEFLAERLGFDPRRRLRSATGATTCRCWNGPGSRSRSKARPRSFWRSPTGRSRRPGPAASPNCWPSLWLEKESRGARSGRPSPTVRFALRRHRHLDEARLRNAEDVEG